MMRQSDRKDLFEERYEAASITARELEEEARLFAEEGDAIDKLAIVRNASDSSHLATPIGGQSRSTSSTDAARKNKRDTHYFDVDVRFRSVHVPMRIPLSTFEEEVGDVS
jgi:hypothetical protein